MEDLVVGVVCWGSGILRFEEGKRKTAGITGISWDRFRKNFTRVDAYESKVRGGIWCRNCPVDQFWKTLPGDLKKI